MASRLAASSVVPLPAPRLATFGLTDQTAAACADDETVAAGVEGLHRFLGRIVALGEIAEELLPHLAQGVELAVGAADEEDVALVAQQDSVGLAERQHARDVAFGNAV